MIIDSKVNKHDVRQRVRDLGGASCIRGRHAGTDGATMVRDLLSRLCTVLLKPREKAPYIPARVAPTVAPKHLSMSATGYFSMTAGTGSVVDAILVED